MISLVGILAMIVVMQIPMEPVDLLRVLALTPVLALAGGSLGVLFIGFVQDPKVAGIGVALLVFPQMFLAGAMIPVQNATGILSILAEADADDVQHRPCPQHLLRGQAGIRRAQSSTRCGSTSRSRTSCSSCSTAVGTWCLSAPDRNR